MRFDFDGAQLAGHPGDTLASALLANGIRLVGRSFKYHRPRGVLTAGSEEPNALVELRDAARREPNTRATTIELYDGLSAASQNRWPSLKFDVLAANQIFAPIFGAGFYYKTFMWPSSFWEKVYEPMIRRAAGLGRAADAPDPDHYEKAYAFCDVLVVGAGPAGLAAALAAARSGARVILCEEDFRLGGRLLAERYEIEGEPALDWVEAAQAELESLPECRILRRTIVQGVYDGGTYAALERVNDHVPRPPAHEPRQRLWRIVAKRAVICAGAIERPIVFGDNDRPGIMLASAVRSYVNRFGVAPGRRAVIFADNDDAFRTASDLAQAGIAVAAVVDARRTPSRRRARGGRGGASPLSRRRGHRARARTPWRQRGHDQGREGRKRERRLRSHRHVGRLEPHAPPHHPSQRQAAMERRPRSACPRDHAAGHERGRRGQRHIRPRRLSRRRRGRGRQGRLRMRFRRLSNKPARRGR